jgi:hypothetical protein
LALPGNELEIGISDFEFGVNLFFSLNRKRETENAARNACGFALYVF